MLYIDLILNLSLIVTLNISSFYLGRSWARFKILGSLGLGLISGCIAVLGMLRPVNLGPGLIFDGRSVILYLCALFSGPWAALASCLPALAYRSYLGGSGLLTGISVILTSSLIGLGARFLFRQKPQEPKLPQIYLGAILVHLVMLALMLLLPAGRGPSVIKQIGLPVILLYPLAALLAAKLYLDQRRHYKALSELKESQTESMLNEACLAGLFRIANHQDRDVQELLDYALSECIKLTGSRFGYIYFYDAAKKEFTLNTWSRGVMDACKVAHPQTKYQLDKTGIWGEAVRQGRPIILNDYAAENSLKKGVPEGHAPLKNFLTIPVSSGGNIVAVVGVANKEGDYDDSDVRQLSLMMDSVWNIAQRSLEREEKENLKAQLVQSQRMDSIGRLAGGVAHDFNNMLGVILGYIQLALDKLDEGHPVVSKLLEARKATERSVDLTRQLLTFASKQIVQPTIIDLNQAVDGLLSMLKRLIGENIELAWNPGEGQLCVNMDPSQLDQLLTNLCVNARDAISGQGRVRIETELKQPSDDLFQKFPTMERGHFLRLRVSDSGCGMDAETMARIFEPFYSKKERGKGSGLGLATVYGIVKQNHGSVDVHSTLEQGSVFDIYLPQAGSARLEGGKINSEEPSSGRGEKILVVEDEKDLLAMVCDMLRALGYEPLAAASPEEALRRAAQEDYDLILSDVIMPGMNGKELSRRIKELHPKAALIFMSGYTGNIIDQEELGSEGAFFIQKPFTQLELTRIISQALSAPC